MPFQAKYIQQVRNSDDIKTIINKLARECVITHSTQFTWFKGAFTYEKGDEPDCPTKKKLFEAFNAAQVPALELVECIEYLRHYVPGMPFEVMVVNNDRENEPWLFFGLILVTGQFKFDPGSEGFQEFIKRFAKAQLNVGKQIKLFKVDSKDSTSLKLMENLDYFAWL